MGLNEPLRLGAVELMRSLKREGHSVWIYTTSYRSPTKIRLWLALYGVRIDGAINQTKQEHVRERAGIERHLLKYPPAFGIDLHVDDADDVEIEGRKRGYRSLTISPQDTEWTERVRDTVRKI